MSKKSILTGTLGLLWIFGASLQAQPLAQYTFNDDTPKDISGNGLDGVLLGNAAIVTDPERGQVLQINQSGMRADGPFAITTSFTLSAWIKLDVPRTGRFYFGGPWQFRTDNQGSPEHYWIEVRYPGGNFLNKIDTRTAENSQGQLDGQWHHLVLVLPEDGAFKGYFDGVLAPFRDANPVRVHDFGGSIGPLFFGTQDESGGNAIAGYMDDIRVYDYAVSEEEVLDLMTEGSGSVQAYDPEPENRATGVLVDGLTLHWKTGLDPDDANFPNPDIEKHYLWVTKPYDPMNPPGGPDWGDPAVQTFTIGADTDPPDGSVDPNASKAVPGLQKDSLYFWAVDEGLVGSTGPEDPTNIWGDTWIFETETTGPEVDAGSSVVTWLKAGATIVDVNGTVTDGSGDVTTILWSVLSSPPGSTVDIADDSVAVTTATFTQTGLYILQLYAKDATAQEDSDRIEVNVYSDSCEAAKNSLYGYTAPLYDFNNDCKEDFNDFALFATRWLEDASLMSDLLYDAGEITLPIVQFTNPLDSSTVSGQVIINVIAYDPGVGITDGDGMEGAGGVDFEIIDGSGTVLGTHHENTAAFDWESWDTTLPIYPNGDYTIRVTAESDAGYQTIKEISVTVNNP